ncbi:MAG: ABC transporter permease [Rubrivivax sp.]|nr:ABC transporter permease [Rubrivivax sp.]
MARARPWHDPERWLGAATVVGLVAMLEAAVRSGGVNAALVPAPSTVAVRLGTILQGGDAWRPLGETLALLAAAYAVGCALAVAAGLAMGRSAWMHGLLEPLVEVLRPLPKPALLPPLILFLGLGAPMKLTVIALGVFFPVLVNTVQGVRGTEPVLLDAARTFGHTRLHTLLAVVLPASLPMVLAGMRVSLGLGLVLVIVAEMMAGTGGVGYLILDMQRSFRVPEMYAWIVILAVLGWALNAVFVRLEGRVTRWSFATRD